jgi:PASTA domain/IPT/TIG domain
VYKVLRTTTVAAVMAIASTMAFTAAAQAQRVVGQLAPGSSPFAACDGAFESVPFSVFDGTTYEAPGNGVITSWSTNAAAGPNQTLTFKVFRQVMPDVFVVVAHDTRPLTPGVVNTFKTNIPVKVNDVIGQDSANASPATPNACEFFTSSERENTFIYPAGAPDGGLIGPRPDPENETDASFRPNVSATFLEPPSVTVDGRGSLGPVTGGAPVVLAGFNFAEVTSVSIGGVPARFTVNSEQQITAVAPPGKTLNEVGISVTTLAGTATTPEVFSYQGCLVPKLTRKKLKAAKTRLKGGGCKLGKVKKVKGSRKKAGKVLKQSPKPGTVLAPGSRVSVTLGR